MDNHITTKRLSYIKLLYRTALKQSYQKSMQAEFSILGFHDCIEMFLKLLAEQKGIRPKKVNGFIDYWNLIDNPPLTHKGQMNTLNKVRNNLKHHGISPSKADIEYVRVNTTDFFNINTLSQFDIEFKDVSLINLIQYEEVKHYLDIAQKALDLENFEKEIVIENTAIAFQELLRVFMESKTEGYYSSLFDFGDNERPIKGRDINLGISKFERFVDQNNNTISKIQNVLKVLSLGIDYSEYVKFNFLTPVIRFWSSENKYEPIYSSDFFQRRKLTKENCQFCIDFVIENSLKLQELEFDINDLITKTPAVNNG